MEQKEKFYPYISSSDFKENILNKYEFSNQPKRKYIYQEPRQLLLRNYISLNTIYDNVLLYFSTGVGKTCAAISIAEGFKEYVLNNNKKIIVLVKNENIEKNFRNEILTKCTNNEYITDDEREIINGRLEGHKELMSKINRQINKVYDFRTYRSFVNQVIGMIQYEKDITGASTKKKIVDGEEVRKIVDSSSGKSIQDFNNTVIIIDEAHNIKGGDLYNTLEILLKKSINYRLILLTATPMYDSSKEIIYLSNLLNMNDSVDKLIDIKNPNIFTKYLTPNSNNRMLKGDILKITDYGKELLKKSLAGKISYLHSSKESFPEKIDLGEPIIPNKIGSVKVIYCEMSDHQYNIYRQTLNLDSQLTYNENVVSSIENIETIESVEDNITRTKVDSLYKNSSDVSTFVFSNGSFGKDGFNQFNDEANSQEQFTLEFTRELRNNSEKLFQLLNNIKNAEGNIFIYSNYVSNGGTSLIKHMLLKNGYIPFSKSNQHNYNSFIMFDDSTKPEQRSEEKAIFNSSQNKDGRLIKIIIGSPVISEGITLKNIRHVHILEPSWNMSKLNQIIGRAIRNQSHFDLPEDKRNVKIYKYCSVYSKDTNGIFIDKEKYILSEEKDRSIKEIERLLKQISFDCSYNKIYQKSANKEINGSPECDYTNCDFECDVNPKIDFQNLDKSTYNLYIEFFDKYDIEFNIGEIKKLFKEYYIWNIDDIISILKNNSNGIVSNESIYKTLLEFIDNKTVLHDKYNREGFLIQKGDFLIFNPVNVDISSSIFSKVLDFQENINKYTISQFIERDPQYSFLKKIEPSVTEIEETEEDIEEEELSDEDIKYNKKVMKNKIYGSYRQRPIENKETGELPKFGKIDNKLRLVDKRNLPDEEEDSDEEEGDKRKNISGTVITSYKNGQLIDIIKYFNISLKNMKKYLKTIDDFDIEDLQKYQYITIIKEYLKEHNLILR